MHEENLQRGAALAVERQRASHRLLHGIVEIDLRQDDARVLRVQSQRGAQAVRTAEESLVFSLPKELRRDMKAAGRA